MVAPHNSGIATRSFVRISGSGPCSAAGTVYMDFSRVCGAAAIVAARHRPPQAVMQAQHRRLSNSMDAAFLRKMAAIEDSFAESARVEIGGSEARRARREVSDLRAGARAGGGASARPAAGEGRGVPARKRTSALPARDRSPDGGQRKRLRSHPSEENGKAIAPPQAKAPKTIYIVVGGAGAVSPTPSEEPVGMKGDDARLRMVAAGQPFLLSAESLRRLMDQTNRLLQENQAPVAEGAGLSA
ncbi:uncharacterized protein LOC119571095 [Penaeus monodon]|uniref:uncharacterized protein LOC119571095 n=1 Tax=Penaeus monodon TaxID=6687 RepID=UPI0018A7A6F5|nr:uncharacterized protein LOC119571095 [Penaeus monodon]